MGMVFAGRGEGGGGWIFRKKRTHSMKRCIMGYMNALLNLTSATWRWFLKEEKSWLTEAVLFGSNAFKIRGRHIYTQISTRKAIHARRESGKFYNPRFAKKKIQIL